MMKILLIFSLSLISGPVGCAVTGYLGGSVMIISEQRWSSTYSRYICKKEVPLCTDIIRSRTSLQNSAQVGRFRIFKNRKGFLSVLIRNLKPQDAGEYRIGTWTDVNLKVVNESCCTEPKAVSAFPGQNINIILNYPVGNERRRKYLVKLDSRSVIKHILDTSTQPWNTKFYISDDRTAKVLSMNINNVREPDAGVYLVGIYRRINSVQYFSFFSEIQLNVTAPKEILSQTEHFTSSFTIIIISVCVCVTLLLIGGLVLFIYKLKHKRTQGSSPSSQDTVKTPSVHETDLPDFAQYVNLNFRMTSNLQNQDSSYRTLNPFTNQSDSGHTSLNNTTCQSESQYQSLNPRTQANSIYKTLQS